MEENIIKVNVLNENATVTVSIPVTDTTTPEDVCITLCKELNVKPVARHLFSLRKANTNIYLTPDGKFDKNKPVYDLRIRFKVSSPLKLRDTDQQAYEYYFLQARKDVLENKVPDLCYDRHKNELVGLGIVDMYRAMVEKNASKTEVVSEYKKFIPKEVVKRHSSFFMKRDITTALSKIEKLRKDDAFVKQEYLKQVDILAPQYLIEEYKVITDIGESIYKVFLRISPHDVDMPGLKYCFEVNRQNWTQVCEIEDIAFVTVRQGCLVEINRSNGIPFYAKFNSEPEMMSFLGLLDGYYRLTTRWMFNLCTHVVTPSVTRLKELRSHGPIGGEFSYAKLEEKRATKPGCYIIRESEMEYDVYFIDVCTNDSRNPKTFKIDLRNKNGFMFNGDTQIYHSIQEVIKAHSDPNKPIFLQECLPASDYDISPNLLCRPEIYTRETIMSTADVMSMLPDNPVCLGRCNFEVFTASKKNSYSGLTFMYRSMWRIKKGIKVMAAKKCLKEEHCEKYLLDFVKLIPIWGYLQHSTIARMFGFTFSDQISIVTEYFQLGPLNVYLREKREVITKPDLLEASANLASALWHLNEKNITHGKIRCRKLFVASHDTGRLVVKLSDPGLHKTYDSSEIHWIPVDCYLNPESARKSRSSDVWAFATTLYEIFTLGEPIVSENYLETKQNYLLGKRLPKPPMCFDEVYELMKRCWEADPKTRIHPQVIMRDINQLLCSVARQPHVYARIAPKLRQSVSASTIPSVDTESTILPSVAEMPFGKSGEADEVSCDFADILSIISGDTLSTSLESFKPVFEFNEDSHLILQGRIGQGFYGEVFRGTLEYINRDDQELQTVAVKKLKPNSVGSCLDDFEREIDIMKTLNHPNIVKILGVLDEPEVSLVMEFVERGSLLSYLKIYNDSLTAKQLLKYALDIANGMDYLGKMKIVHRDLAARNILVVDKNNVKISDFGLAQMLGNNEYYILKTNRDLPIKWYAIESLREGKFSVKSDVWSYGVTLCEIFSHGEDPQLTGVDFTKTAGQEQQTLLDVLETGARFPCPKTCPTTVYASIISPCWRADPHERPLFGELSASVSNLLLMH